MYNVIYNIYHEIDISHNKPYMQVTRIYSRWFFPIEKAVKTVLLGEFVFIVAFLSNYLVNDIEMVRRFWVLFRTFTFLGTKHFLLMVSYLSFYLVWFQVENF